VADNGKDPGGVKRKLLKISQLADRADVSIPTIKHYVRQGLLPKPIKTSRNMGYYPASSVEKIKLIKQLQKEKFLPLAVIKRLIDTGASYKNELALGKAIFKSGPASSTAKQVPLSEIEAKTGFPLEQIDILEEQDLIHPVLRGDKKVYSEEDQTVIAIARKRQDLGLPFDLSLGTLKIYKTAMARAVRNDINFFVRNIMGDIPTQQAVRLLTEADETLDRYVMVMRNKLLRHFSAETIQISSDVARVRSLLNFLPPAASDVRSQSGVDDPLLTVVRRLLQQRFQPAFEAAGTSAPTPTMRALYLIAAHLGGETAAAVNTVRETLSAPTRHPLLNKAAALTCLYAVDAACGLSTPLLYLKKMFAFLNSGRKENRACVLENLAADYIKGIMCVHLPGVFDMRPAGIAALNRCRRAFQQRVDLPEATPPDLRNFVADRLQPAFLVRVDRLLAAAYLAEGNIEKALQKMEAVVDRADPDSDDAAWARLKKMRLL